ncbi:alpha-protein kinase 1-like isoform X2 [Amphibalanus amphitrite]|uniref:alpha-protein kinase 1-like isoform X2 n=1 Tax=Amphibalanus amphitrite TaxID=1232801 RepID=UPI001C916017|nr:alpha-protein kinase 1-like isoform X2 [Amphibalanus amphitrite]
MMRTVLLLTAAVLGAAADHPPPAVSSYQAGAAVSAAPQPVQDTYEVAEAKRAFQQEYQKLAREAELAPDTHQYTAQPQFYQQQPQYYQQQPRPAYTLGQAPQPVQDTYEVAEAKRAFHQEYQKLAREAELAPDTHQYTAQPQYHQQQPQYYQQQPRPAYTLGQAPQPVQDTYEVAEAKRAFQQEYQKLAREAELAPDTHQYTAQPQYYQQQPQYYQQQPRPAYTLGQAPQPVQDTYEVAEAKRAFQQEYQKLAREAELAPDTHQYTAQPQYYQQQPRPAYTPGQAPQPVQDTYEVAEAKRVFQQEYQKLAREAELAPDTHQYTKQPQYYQQQPQYYQQQPRPAYTLGQAPQPVQDTYEVAEAKRAFQQEYQKLAREAELAPDTHQYTAQPQYYQQQPRPAYTPGQAPQPVQDTYEVAEAKRVFQQEYQKLAREAELAPDTHQYTEQPQYYQQQPQYYQQKPRPAYTLGQAPQPVQDTYEVAQAKRAFQMEFDRRAALAQSPSYN